MTFAALVSRNLRAAGRVLTRPTGATAGPGRPAAASARQPKVDFRHLSLAQLPGGPAPRAVPSRAEIRASWETALAVASGKLRLPDAPPCDPKIRAGWAAALKRAGVALKPPWG